MPNVPAPGIIPKVALTVARIEHKPFEVPARLSNSATLTGGAAHNLVGKTNAAVVESIGALQPKGPAKWLLEKFATRSEAALGASMGKADRNLNVFWKPLSVGSEQIGQAIANPLAAFYAHRAGFAGTPEELTALVHSKGYPVAPPPGDGAAAPASAPPPKPAADAPSSAPAADDNASPPPKPAADEQASPTPKPAADEQAAPAAPPAAGGRQPAQ